MHASVLLSSIMCGTLIVYETAVILKEEYIRNKKKLFIASILISLITYFSYRIKYNAESSLFKIALYILTFKIMYNESTYKVIISTFIIMALMVGCDLLSTLIFIAFITIDQMRGVWYWVLMCNIVVCFLTYLIFRVPIIKEKIQKFVYNLNDNSKFSTVFLLLISVTVILRMLYNISLNYNWGENYLINIIIGVAFLIIVIIFLKDRINYYNLMKKYDLLFEWLKELENSVEESYLINHEYKNQLAVIKGYINKDNTKMANKYIDDILNEVNTDEIFEMAELKYVPKGGIKGLLYYKILCAKSKKVTIALDISDKVTPILSKFSCDKNKILSKTLGIYLDNAIEAAMVTRKKIVNIEMYLIEDNMCIVISNSINKKDVDLKSISNRGYTTKGKGHGQGLYLVNKTIGKYNWLNAETKIINNYSIQKLKMNTKKITS